MNTKHFLKIAGIKGSSNHAQHRGEMDLLNWWPDDATNKGRLGLDRPGQIANIDAGEITCTKYPDQADAKLLEANASGRHIPEVILTTRREGDDQDLFFALVMKSVVIAGYQLGGSAGDTFPILSITLSFEEATYTSVVQARGAVEGKWK
ncbi:MAG TPA: type VI secretion system tube protein Hcp [Pyrinomonadaceae bacterium]